MIIYQAANILSFEWWRYLSNISCNFAYGNIDNDNISFCSNSFFWANGKKSKIWAVAI